MQLHPELLATGAFASARIFLRARRPGGIGVELPDRAVQLHDERRQGLLLEELLSAPLGERHALKQTRRGAPQRDRRITRGSASRSRTARPAAPPARRRAMARPTVAVRAARARQQAAGRARAATRPRPAAARVARVPPTPHPLDEQVEPPWLASRTVVRGSRRGQGRTGRFGAQGSPAGCAAEIAPPARARPTTGDRADGLGPLVAPGPGVDGRRSTSERPGRGPARRGRGPRSRAARRSRRRRARRSPRRR